jgi:hypothetical protein
MSNPVNKVRAPSVTAKIGDVVVPVLSISLYHTINSLPYVEFAVALDNSPNGSGIASIGGVQIDITKIRQLGKLIQEKIYNNFSLQPDVEIVITDDTSTNINTNTLTFVGFLCNPEFQAAAGGQFQLVFTALHSMVRLQAFNAQIYYWSAYYATNQDAFQNVFEAYFGTNYVKDDSITNRTLAGLNGLMKDFTSMREAVNSPTAGVTFQAENNSPTLFEPVQWNVHVLNQLVLPAVNQVLSESSKLTEIEGLTSANTAALFSDAPLHRTIFDTLTGSMNMLDALTNLCSPFMFQMNATWSDHLWLEHLQTMEVPQSMIIAPTESISFNLSSAFEIPILQVIVRGPGSNFYDGMPVSQGSDVAPVSPSLLVPEVQDSVVLSDQSLRILGRYPSSVPTVPAGVNSDVAEAVSQASNLLQLTITNSTGNFGTPTTNSILSNKQLAPMPGRYVYIDAPSWIAADFNLLTPDVTDALTTATDMALDLVAGLPSDQDRYAAMSTAKVPFLNYMARSYFNDLFLNRSTARVTVPLVLTPQVGRTYFLKATGQDASLYIGYLQSVKHTIVVGDQAIASTELVFTHVQSRDATLTPVVLGNASYGVTAQQLLDSINNSESRLNAIAAKGTTYNVLSPDDLAQIQLQANQVAQGVLNTIKKVKQSPTFTNVASKIRKFLP